MYLSNYYLSTLKDTPAEAEVVSHQYMLRAGLIKQVAAGIYAWSPMGLSVYRKVEQIVREEMNRAGALEVDLPNSQPAELWQESGRWDKYGPLLLRYKNRAERDFCLGPTHEEVITDFLRGQVNSYKQLPINLYQIQKKYRDEMRPRFGVMRGREFLMKDAYSFHLTADSLQETYDKMYEAYSRIFDRLGLAYRAVLADNGDIGGDSSHEFQVLAETGEDYIAYSTESDYAANIEKTECLVPDVAKFATTDTLTEVHTPNLKTCEAVSDLLGLPLQQHIKTLVIEDENDDLVGVCLRADHSLNDIKVEKIEGIKVPMTMASAEKVKSILGCDFGSIGPVKFNGRVIVDRAISLEQSLICGANKDDYHLTGLNWQRDVAEFEIHDVRNVIEGDPSPDGQGTIAIQKGIEVGHIFQLGSLYSEKLNFTVLDENGKAKPPLMGCYGIGVTRIVAAAIEQNHDEHGIIWPEAITPFSVVIAPIGFDKDDAVKAHAEALYQTLLQAGINVCLDNRGKRPGVMFAELDLIGIPHRVVIGQKTLADNEVEYKPRHGEAVRVGVDEIANKIKSLYSDASI